MGLLRADINELYELNGRDADKTTKLLVSALKYIGFTGAYVFDNVLFNHNELAKSEVTLEEAVEQAIEIAIASSLSRNINELNMFLKYEMPIGDKKVFAVSLFLQPDVHNILGNTKTLAYTRLYVNNELSLTDWTNPIYEVCSFAFTQEMFETGIATPGAVFTDINRTCFYETGLIV